MSAPVSVTVEMYLNGAWTDITSYVRLNPGIDITFGIQSESATSDASVCSLVVNNRDGRFSPRYTSGAYYPHLKRNTPLRVKVGTTIRFVGELSEFPSRWNQNGADVWVTLTASGLLRRLAHAKQLDSTLTTAVRSLSNITGYWPCEDDARATSLASDSPTGTPGIIVGSPVLDAVDLGVGTHNVPTWAASSALFYPTAATATKFTAGCYVKLPTTGLTGGEQLFRVDVGGSAQSWRVLYSPASNGAVFVQCLSSTGVELLASSNITDATGLDGKTFYIKIECSNSGSNVAWALSTLDAGGTVSGSISTATVGAPTLGMIGGGTIAIPAGADYAAGHVVLASTDTALYNSTFDSGRAGYAGESVDARMARLATQYGITINVTAGATAPTEMGAQPDGSLLDVLRAAEKADAGGILRDSIDAVSLEYLTRRGRYNDQRALLSLDYSLKHVIPPFEPVDDDQQIRNDVKVNRDGGSSARKELTSGALSSADYPSGVGPYPFEDTYGVYADTQLPYLASWILRLGTVDETRFPAVAVDLIANPSKVGNVEAVRPGWRLEITNLPAYAGTSTATLQVVGWREHISSHERRVTFVCTPQAPWNVFELNDSTYGVLGTGVLAY